MQPFFITAMATENAIEMLGTSCISCNITTYVSIIKTDGFKNYYIYSLNLAYE